MMSVRLRFPAFGIVLLSIATACAADPPMTPAQHLYLAQSAYVAALEQAAAYREQCDAKPAVLRSTCSKVVAELQAIDRDVEPLFDDALAAVENSNGNAMSIYADAIAAAKARLEQRLAEALIEQARQPLEAAP